MHRFIGLIARFRRDERGAFAVMFGLMAIVLIAMGGAVVDYVTLEQTRNRAQIALDAAALALQPEIFKTPLDKDDIKARARDLMVDRIGEEWNVVVDDPLEIEVNVAEGSLYFRARVTVPTLFVTLVGVDELSAQIQSEATRRQLALEVVMVLDNSGSMLLQNRMTYLQAAAKCATYTLFFTEVQDAGVGNTSCVNTVDAELVENVKVGVVPFTMFVNVGPSNIGASWIDSVGVSSLSNDNFDDDDNDSTAFAGMVNRLDLFADVNEAWRGCVEARPHTKTGVESTEYLDTDDTAPLAGDTLFVPMFSTDLPDSIYAAGSAQSYLSDQPAACYYPGTCSRAVRDSSCTSNYNSCNTTTNGAWSLSGPQGMTGALTCNCDNRTVTNGPYSNGESGNGNRRFWRDFSQSCTYDYPAQGLSQREQQERLCKYTGSVLISGFSNGPNADCTREPILPLAEDPDAVIDTIEDMVAAGGTNIHEGTVWGYRVLSPDLPFQQADSYEDTATSKVMIIMTDGENTAYNINGNTAQNSVRALNGSIWYSAYGWPYNARLGALGSANNVLVNSMNERTLQSCANAKRGLTANGSDKIRVYTIGLATDTVSQSTPTVVRQMLRDCASEPSMAHFPASPTELKSVFAAIAGELAALRLAQ